MLARLKRLSSDTRYVATLPINFMSILKNKALSDVEKCNFECIFLSLYFCTSSMISTFSAAKLSFFVLHHGMQTKQYK